MAIEAGPGPLMVTNGYRSGRGAPRGWGAGSGDQVRSSYLRTDRQC